MKTKLIALCILAGAGALLFGQESEEPQSGLKLGVSLDAVAAVQSVAYNHISETGEAPVADPLITGGFGREDGNRSELNVNFTANYKDLAGLFADISFYPWWQDNRDQDLLINLGSVELGQVGGWIRPVSWLSIYGGRFEIPYLRGKIDGYNWAGSTLIGAEAGGFDSAFTEFDGTNAVALELNGPFQNYVSGLKGLYLAAMIYNMEELGVANNQGVNGGYAEAKFIPENLQVALGYTIENVGLARVQYIGVHHVANISTESANGVFAKNNEDDNTGPRLQAAFTFDSPLVPGLLAEVGGTFSFPVTDPTSLIPGLNADGLNPYEIPLVTKGTFQEPHRVAAGVQYDFDAVGLKGLAMRVGVQSEFGGYSQPEGSGKTEYAPLTKIWFAPSYRFTDSFKLLADLGVNISGNQRAYDRIDKRGGTRVGAGLFAQYTVFGNNSFLRAGIVYSGGYILGETPVEALHLDDLLSFPVQFHWEF